MVSSPYNRKTRIELPRVPLPEASDAVGADLDLDLDDRELHERGQFVRRQLGAREQIWAAPPIVSARDVDVGDMGHVHYVDHETFETNLNKLYDSFPEKTRTAFILNSKKDAIKSTAWLLKGLLLRRTTLGFLTLPMLDPEIYAYDGYSADQDGALADDMRVLVGRLGVTDFVYLDDGCYGGTQSLEILYSLDFAFRSVPPADRGESSRRVAVTFAFVYASDRCVSKFADELDRMSRDLPFDVKVQLVATMESDASGLPRTFFNHKVPNAMSIGAYNMSRIRKVAKVRTPYKMPELIESDLVRSKAEGWIRYMLSKLRLPGFWSWIGDYIAHLDRAMLSALARSANDVQVYDRGTRTRLTEVYNKGKVGRGGSRRPGVTVTENTRAGYWHVGAGEQ